jgi:hypothetical protein
MNKKAWKKIPTYIFQFVAFWFGAYLMWQSARPDRLEAGIFGFLLALGVAYAVLSKDYENKLREKDETILVLSSKNHASIKKG